MRSPREIFLSSISCSRNEQFGLKLASCGGRIGSWESSLAERVEDITPRAESQSKFAVVKEDLVAHFKLHHYPTCANCGLSDGGLETVGCCGFFNLTTPGRI